MRVLMYGWEFPPHISGGLGVACYGMTSALAESGHKITFVIPRLKNGMDEGSHVDLLGVSEFPMTRMVPEGKLHLEKISGVDFQTIDSTLMPYQTSKSYQERIETQGSQASWQQSDTSIFGDGILQVSGDYGPDLMSEIARYARVAGHISRQVPHDIIHAHDWLTMPAGVEAKRVSGKPLVVHAHALEFDRSGENVNQAVYDIERSGMEQADMVAAVSHYTKSVIVERYGIDPKKVSVVHNAVVRPDYQEPKRSTGRRDKVVLFLGRITFQKGPDYFVQAAAKVLERRDDVRFVMAGSGDMAPKIIEQVAALGIGRRFHFTGFLTGDAVTKMYEEADVYVMPSVSEPFGISPLEAMRHDVPTIISKQSGVSEIVSHALKVNFWDVDELTDKILALVDHGALRRELSVQGSNELDGIKWSNAAAELTQIYGQLTASI